MFSLLNTQTSDLHTVDTFLLPKYKRKKKILYLLLYFSTLLLSLFNNLTHLSIRQLQRVTL